MNEKTFEQALARLEEIIKNMEEGNLSLEASLDMFEEGIKLSRYCARKLEDAERKVELLLKEGDEDYVTLPFQEGTDNDG